ncbi:fibronectin type III domain-containing protein [Nonlabens ulvanivorans]|uniref:fibronectin type III domain-containing protein n=1 Tax=Nonlabens ulvanivorans TaxID=906888 RepID=UPI0037C57AA4
MKKYLSIIFISFLFLFSAFAKAQQEPTTVIKTKGRYINNTVELRFFPDRKSTLKLAFKSGFIIERANGSAGNFVEIGRTTPYSEAQWLEVMNAAPNEDKMNEIELAMDFYLDVLEDNGGTMSFNDGIGELKNQKAAEDFQLMISLLTAIKNAEAAKGLGFSYVDQTVANGVDYTYRVKLVAPSTIYKIESIPFSIKAINNSDALKNKVYIKTGDTELGFVWNEHPDLSGVDVERTINGKNVKLNKAPIYAIRGSDYDGPKRTGFDEDSLVNYQKYTYRFYAQTLFGERVQFAEVTGMPRDKKPPQQPFLKQPQHAQPDEVHIEWEMQAPIAGDFKGFAISRSEENNGTFTLLHDKLLPQTARKFIDKSFLMDKTNYYLVQAVDTANNVSSSFPVAVTLIDSIPPSKPIFIKGKIDSTGVVTVDIKKNPEADLMGYRLYRSNAAEHEFSAIKEGFLSIDSMGRDVKTVYKDTVTLKSLTPYIYYRVEALDFNHNTSEFSEILKVKRPDKIAPTTPVFKKIKSTEDVIELQFALSKSIDVKEQILYRKTDLKAPWEKYQILKNDQLTFIDKNVKKGTIYYYSMRAIDESENASEYAVSVQGKTYKTGVRPPVEDLRITTKNGEVTLVWSYKDLNEETYFVIYKKNKDGQFVRHGRSLKLRFSESEKNKSTYAVKVFTTDGGQSKLSKEVSF